MANDKTQELQVAIDAIDWAGGPGLETPAPATPEATPVEPAAAEDPTLTVPKEETPKETIAEPEAATPETPAEPTAEEPPAKETPAIPDSHYRAALHANWTAEEIGKLMDTDPDLALKTFAKLHESYNASSKQLGELGQKMRQLKDKETAGAPTPSQAPAVDEWEKKLREKYEDDPIVELVIEQRRELKQKREPVESPRSDPQRDIETEIAQRQQINQFFAGDEMSVFKDHYGKTGSTENWQNLTPAQIQHRKEVCDQAQIILDGAAMAGLQISSAEALERAHVQLTAPMAAQFVRDRIVQSVQKRAKGVTLKPSSSKTPEPTGGTYNKTKAIETVANLQKKIFGG